MPASFPHLGLFGTLYSIVPLLRASEPTTDAALIGKGRYVARLGDCIACHTDPQGAPMTGDLELRTPMGTIYSTNVIPDRETGIDRYSFEEFDRAMRKGMAVEGVNLYPAIPYPSYARISEESVRALHAYPMHGMQPVTRANTPSAMSWPFNQRWGLSLWNWAFLDDAPFTPSNDADSAINRGAYLIQRLGHYGACHTPHDIAFQEKAISEAGRSGQLYLAGETVEQWQALSLYNLWTVEGTVQLLKTGQNRFATVSGGVTDVIRHNTQYFSDDDLLAVASYLKSLPVSKDDLPVPDNECPLAAPVDLYSSRGGLGYAQFRSDCHRKDNSGAPGVFPPLAGNPTVASANPGALLHITLTGWKTAETAAHSRVYTMPGFAQLEDHEVAEILSFVHSSQGNQGSSIDAGQVEKLRRRVEAGNDPATTFASPRLADMLTTPNAEQMVCGTRLYPGTHELLSANVGNQLDYTSCHLNAGTVADGSPFVGVSAFFPSYAPRAGEIIGLGERINGCFRRSMNGKSLPPNSADMQAMVVYFDWMKSNTRPQDKVAGRGIGRIGPALKPDPENGHKVYARQCAVCHSENGKGLRDSAGEMLFPPLWGGESFSIDAGMARVFTTATFVKHNMPVGFQERFPLDQGGPNDQDAMDIVEYFSYQPRPDFPGKIKDWPKDKRPLDAHY